MITDAEFIMLPSCGQREIRRLREALTEIAKLQTDKAEHASAEMMFMLLQHKVDLARAALGETAASRSTD